MTSNKSKYSTINHDLTQNIANDVHDDPSRNQHINDLIDHEHEIKNRTFYQTLMNYINEKKLDPVNVYKRAGIDRKLFWKIRSLPKYIPAKKDNYCSCFSHGTYARTDARASQRRRLYAF